MLLCVIFLSLSPCTHAWWDSQQHYYCLSAIFSSSSSIGAGLYPDVSLLSSFFCPLLIFIRRTYKEGLSLSWMFIFWPQTFSCGKQTPFDTPTSPMQAVCLTQRRNTSRTSELGRLLQDTAWAFLYRTTNPHPESGIGNSSENIQAVCLW